MSERGRPCAVCSDPRRPELEAALARPDRPSYAVLADSYPPLSPAGIRRHHLKHTGGGKPEGPVAGGDLVAFGARLERMVALLVEEANRTGSFRDVGAALRVGLEAHAALLKAHAARPPAWDPLRDEVIRRLVEKVGRALEELPEARDRVLAAMREATP